MNAVCLLILRESNLKSMPATSPRSTSKLLSLCTAHSMLRHALRRHYNTLRIVIWYLLRKITRRYIPGVEHLISGYITQKNVGICISESLKKCHVCNIEIHTSKRHATKGVANLVVSYSVAGQHVDWKTQCLTRDVNIFLDVVLR